MVRRRLGEIAHRIELLLPSTVLMLDLVLVERALTDALNPQTPAAGARDQLHVVASPPVEVAYDLHALSIGGPHSEADAGQVAALVVMHRHHMGAKSLPEFCVAAAVEPFQIPTSQVPELVVSHVNLPSC